MILALAHHSMLESSDVIQDIKEMAALIHGLLSSDVSTSGLICVIDAFYTAVARTFYLDDAKLPPEKVVQVLREVEMILPHSPGSHSEFDSNLPQIEKNILKCRRLLASTPRSHPYRPPLLWRLGLLQYQVVKANLSPQKDDLDGSINSITEAVLLSFRPSRGVIYMFIELARVLADRFAYFRQPEDAKSSIKYFHFVRILFHPLEAFGIWHVRWLSGFVTALAVNVGCLELGSGDMTQELEEIVTLIMEILASDEASTEESWKAICAFRAAVITSAMFRRKETQEISERAIRLLREATLLKPDSHNASFALASCLAERFKFRATHVSNDYEEAIAIADKILAVSFPGDGPTTMQIDTIGLIQGLLASRLSSDWRPEYLEDAIYRIRTLLCLSNLPDHDLEQLTLSRKALEGCRSLFGITWNSRESFPNPLASSLLMISQKSVVRVNSVPQYPLDAERFDQLAKVHTAILRGDMMDAELEAVVEYSRKLLPVQRDYTQSPFLSAIYFANILLYAYARTKRIDYVDEAIITYRKLREAATPKDIHFSATVGLLHCHGICASPNNYTRYHFEEGLLEECIHLLSEAANDGSAMLSRRFELSCKWAFIARFHTHPSTSTAYETSMSIMQETLTFSPTLQFQHLSLAGMPRHMLGISSDYASHQIGTGQVKQAIETLERGRALLWSELRGLRTSAGQLELRAADSSLANKLADINQRLESVTVSVAQSDTQAVVDSGTETVTGTGRREPEVMDSIGVLVTTQRRLVDERNSIISHIQSLPGFETFLKPSSFDVLNSAAARGPVIIINQSRLGDLSNAENQLCPSHIIILLKDLPPSVISAPWNFHDRAYQLKSDLLHVRKRKGLDSDDYDLTLAKVLSDLYELVGKPVIEKLNQLEVPKGSRVWWCPTGDFCSLPLHAMGPIPSDDGNEVYFSDMYIPSYTPTLSALIESRKPGLASEASDNLKPSILLVAQPDTLPGAWGEIGVIQASKTPVTTLVSAMATPRTVIEGLRDHRFAHFVCHGLLETGKPFDASLELHGDNLTLLEIVRSQLPDAELAFLSACHTAELTEDSVDDEGLHLAAAMQYCGFRSVVGTMWAMADTDGTDLSKHFYKAIFSEKAGQNGVPYHERSARALQVAVKKLRGKRGISLERWVNFVHYGA
ncbi:CHAT domain-containing protein [Lactarius quietus]|nr:CHAT domain-containing protein [Lactarius quietus]